MGMRIAQQTGTALLLHKKAAKLNKELYK